MSLSQNCKEIEAASAVVWLLDLNQVSDRHDDSFGRFLSMSERQRYAAFFRPQRRRQFLFGRVLLRFAVSRSTNVPVDRIIVEERRENAPAILNSDCWNLSFSLSHARQWVACAIGFGCRLGVDIEVVDSARDVHSISEIAFHPEDRRLLSQKQQNDFVLEFYRLWCTREAVLKLNSDAYESGSPLTAGSGRYSYASFSSGFTTVICSNRRLNDVQQIEVISAANQQLTFQTVMSNFSLTPNPPMNY